MSEASYLHSAPFTEHELRCIARVLEPDKYPLPGEDFTDIINEALRAVRRVMDAAVSLHSEPEYRLWVNETRTVLVRLWKSGTVEVATRESPQHTWSPPILCDEEKV